jgi:hypothetical protein
MRTAIVLCVLVLVVILGGLLTLRRSAKTGMPPEDVMERVKRRARELEQREKMSKEED